MSGESPEYYKTLTVKQAKELAQHGEEGDFLVLDRVTTLSHEAAKELAKHQGDLWLRGLNKLSDEASQALSQHKRKLYLDGLTTLSTEAAKALRSHPKISLPTKFKR